MKPVEKHQAIDQSTGVSPNWLWMFFGFSIGLLIAGVLYIQNTNFFTSNENIHAASQNPPQNRLEPAPETQTTQHPAAAFTFYEDLPGFEFEVSGINSDINSNFSDSENTIVERFILQAGAFRLSSDAERMKENLALLDIESNLQEVTVNSNDFHRVLIGPIEGTNEMNRIREKLLDANIEVLARRMSD
ncbi:MAG: hypothetical protein CMM56_08965 [Rhodospirillaceae bacterium]|nr:hypothetical protein [Rhodospirillaceae bacterium]|tara:strand:- start:2682 stop:3248 length:567 start_codon:yes stop_codon:yes gene_type:complete